MPDGGQEIDSSDLAELLAGLGKTQKSLPAKLFYDAEGCRLFGEITRLPEYYPTRTEEALLARVAPTLERFPGCTLVEFGASDERKAIPLLDHLGAAAYVPIDIADVALAALVQRLARSHPGLAVHPIAADFLAQIVLPDAVRGTQMVGFFPGSTIGNLDPDAAHRFMVRARETLGRGALFLVGVDLIKDPGVLIPAYADAQGITAAFNKNILSHINSRFDADFIVANFEHRAVWNVNENRIEMHLVSQRSQSFSVAGQSMRMAEGETIHTENSYKHSIAGFTALASAAGWAPSRVWTDDAGLFSLHLLTAERGAA